MKTLVKILAPVALLVLSGTAFAQTQSDPAQAYKDAVKTKTVNYTCQSGKKVSVKYGFNKQNLPTYAQARLNGKTRFMPVNLNRSDNVSSNFGDENNFSLSAGVITYKNVNKSNIMIQSPASEILFKNCKAK